MSKIQSSKSTASKHANRLKSAVNGLSVKSVDFSVNTTVKGNAAGKKAINNLKSSTATFKNAFHSSMKNLQSVANEFEAVDNELAGRFR